MRRHIQMAFILLSLPVSGFLGWTVGRAQWTTRNHHPREYSIWASRKNEGKPDLWCTCSSLGIRTIYLDSDGDGFADEAFYISYLMRMIIGGTFDTDRDRIHDLSVSFDEEGRWREQHPIDANTPEAGPFSAIVP
jgi:hypothetical protein